MADRYDLKVARPGKDGKVWWTKIGVMFPMKDRDGFNITLEALPLQTLNDQGQMECRITAWEPYKEDQQSGYDNRSPSSSSSSDSNLSPEPDLNGDVIPF
jgi:hypothetical protein